MHAASVTSSEVPAVFTIAGNALISLSMRDCCSLAIIAHHSQAKSASYFECNGDLPKPTSDEFSHLGAVSDEPTLGINQLAQTGPSLKVKLVQREKIILASQSLRRAEILQAVDWPFETIPSGIDETRGQHEDPVTYVRRLAMAKARSVADRLGSGLVLGADTVVVVEGEILGQPRNPEDARRMLLLLNGKWHDVLTAIALYRAGYNSRSLIEHERTRVRFSQLSKDEIDWYVSTGEPLGKAGAYGIQGKAAMFIEEIQGDYFNIVGLPVRLLYELVQRIGD
jgi:septum formation protein